jgi:hypothetical protein
MRVPRKFKRSQICPSFALNTLEKLGVLQCSPWATGAARLAGFRRGRRRGWSGKWGITTGSSPRDYWWWIWGRGRLRRGGTTKTGGGDRGEDCSGELLAGEHARVAREASRCPREGARRMGYHRELAEEGARGWWLAMAADGARLGVRRQRARLASLVL